MKSRHLLANTVTGLEAGCIAGVLWFGARILPAEPLQVLPAPAAEMSDPASAEVEPAAATASELWLDDQVGAASTRSAVEQSDTPDDRVGRRPVASERRGERDYYLAFSALAAHGTADVERAARLALEGHGPDCEKVAALRAVSDKNCPGAFDLFADAVLTLPDVSRPEGDSVPRFAVRVLIDKASREEGARLALDRVAWNRSLSSDMRRIAAAGLAATADEAGAWRIVSRLEIEQDERVRECAAQALARNPAVGSAASTVAQWIPSSPVGGDAGEQQE